MNLRKPNKREVQVGRTIDIINREGETVGKGKLIRRRPSRYFQDGLGYVKYEKVNDTQGNSLYIWSFERWEVEWVKHSYYRPGDRTCTEVHYYECTTTDYPSFVDVNTIGNKGVSQDGLYIFLEEEGVLTLDGETYTKDAIKALKRVRRSCDGEIIVWTHNPAQVKERWELNKVPFRIFEFIIQEDKEDTFAGAVNEYLKRLIDSDSLEDYVILSGVSEVIGDRVIQANINTGLKLK